MIGIGIDTGGTCTDAVIYDMDARKILAAGKALTTKSNLETGIANALDTLPQDLLREAVSFNLSTTLSTNSCVENKGCRAKLLLIGFEAAMVERLRDVFAAYGMTDLTQFVTIPAGAEGACTHPFDPDWEDLKIKCHKYFEECDSVGIVQKNPRANGGRFELAAAKLLKDELTLPITIAYDVSSEVDILKTIASTMLNARLIPLIAEFIEAVHHVMEQRDLHMPLSIVRSDGVIMSEEMAKTYPVETLLCGPAASVIGGSALAKQENAVIIDMGGTTTDIAIVHDMRPVMATEGILIGQWKTMIKGVFVDTFGLGGDTAVRFRNEELFLDTVRVIPISVLAAQYDSVMPALRKLAERKQPHTRWIHEFYVLLKDISGKKGYTEKEQAICAALKDGPLISLDLVGKLDPDTDIYNLNTARLEAEGIIIKSGLTPTDMMIIKGDFTLYDSAAAKLMARYFLVNVTMPRELTDEEKAGFKWMSAAVSEEEREEILKNDTLQLADMVYEMVEKRMYKNIGRILLQKQYSRNKKLQQRDYLENILDICYEQAAYGSGKEIALNITCPMPLVGVGAPTHVFLPRVAELLHTEGIIPEYAHVANALGATVGHRICSVELTIKVMYSAGSLDGYRLFDNGKCCDFSDLKEAVAYGEKVVSKAVRKRAALQGIGEQYPVSIAREDNRIGHTSKGLLLDVYLRATITDQDI